MKNKKGSLRKLTPMPAAAAVLAMAASGAHAQTIPVFQASFPTSWSGTGTTVTDESSAGSIGYHNGTGTYSTTAVPPGAAAGTGSMVLTGGGGIKVTGNGTSFPTDSILNNTAIAADGGFTLNIDFLWTGTASATQKLIDYSGTESLQLTSLTNNVQATLGMAFGGNTGSAPDVDVVTTTILPNTWYNVTMTFNTTGNSVVGGAISGIADLYVNGLLVSSAAATKGDYGDSLGRPIGIGELGYGHNAAYTTFYGDIYDASIDLGVAPVPEPSTIAFAGLGGLSLILMRRKKS